MSGHKYFFCTFQLNSSSHSKPCKVIFKLHNAVWQIFHWNANACRWQTVEIPIREEEQYNQNLLYLLSLHKALIMSIPRSCWDLKCMSHFQGFLPSFTKKDNFYDILFASPRDETLDKRGLLLKERIFYEWSKFLSPRADPQYEGIQKWEHQSSFPWKCSHSSYSRTVCNIV